MTGGTDSMAVCTIVSADHTLCWVGSEFTTCCTITYCFSDEIACVRYEVFFPKGYFYNGQVHLSYFALFLQKSHNLYLLAVHALS